MGNIAPEDLTGSKNRFFGYKNMYVCDGSMISAKPGVNTALSTVAITEYAMSHIGIKKF